MVPPHARDKNGVTGLQFGTLRSFLRLAEFRETVIIRRMKVHKADSGTDDAGSAIEAIAKTAFIYFGGRNGPKRFTAIRPVMASDTDLEVSIGFDTDFRDGTTTFTPSTTSSIASAWDTATWDAATWGAPITTQQAWFSVADIGWNAAVRVRTSTSQQSVRWLATDVRYEVGVGL